MAIDPKTLIIDLLRNRHGVALGEDHKSPEIFDFVRDQAEDFKRSGVKTLYIEAILSADTEKVQNMLKSGDDKGLLAYLQSRAWNSDLAQHYFDLIKEYNKQGIEIVGIDIKTDDRFRTGSKHWESVIADHQKVSGGDYIVFGGASHFGQTFGPGVNVKLGIPSINFSISDNNAAMPNAAPSEELFQGRPVADYVITLPKKKSGETRDIAPLKINGLAPSDIDFIRKTISSGHEGELRVPFEPTTDIIRR